MSLWKDEETAKKTRNKKFTFEFFAQVLVEIGETLLLRLLKQGAQSNFESELVV